MASSHGVLALAVRWRVIGPHLGRAYVVVGALLAPPVAVSLAFGAPGLALVGVLTAGALAAAGWLLQRGGVPDEIQSNEAMAMTALVFVTVPLSLVPLFVRVGLPPAEALFEAVAAVTTAGLTMFDTVSDLPPPFLFTRAWIQWFGGLGFVALCFALTAGPSNATRRIGMEFDRDPGSMSSTYARARRVVVVYGILTAAGFVALWAVSGDWFLALVHALAAMATGGYSSFDVGPAGFGRIAPQGVVMVLCILGAMSFDLHGRLHRRQWQAFVGDPGLRLMLLGIAVVASLVFALEHGDGLEAAWRSLGLAVMAQTTAGFTTHPFEELQPASQGVLAVSMLIGGDVGSTAGGIKLLRLVVVLRLVKLLLDRSALPPHAMTVPRVEGRRVSEPEISALLAFLALLGAVIASSWLVFVLSGAPAFESLIEVVAAVSTGGMSAGLTGTDLPGHLKFVLTFDMLAGRLEVVALIVLCYPGTWIGRRQGGR